jgi:hypothetical protein
VATSTKSKRAPAPVAAPATPNAAAAAYLADVDPATWSWASYLLRYDKRLLAIPKMRRRLCRFDPLLFAVLYLRHHLASEETGGEISVSQFHLDLCSEALTWCRKDLGPAESRTAWVAPRGSGKSTWVFLILPLWAMAHMHRRYIAAFANTSTQAQQHLMSLKFELDNNPLLRADHPHLCTAATRPGGTTVADRQDMYISKSGVAFTAKGIDSSTLGAKVGNRRPDIVLLDDIEPDESNYSEREKEKRLGTILNAVFPMNLNAVVVIAGTPVMAGSIIHDIILQVSDPDAPQWPRDENIAVRYYPAIVTDEDGGERSLWPQRWTLAFLISIRHTASYALNFDNQPVSQGGWWQPGDIRYDKRAKYDRIVMVVDGAVTAKATSDDTGISIVGLSYRERKLFVREAIGIKLTGEPRRRRIIDLIVAFDVDYVLAEANQGGDLWFTELHDLPVKLSTFTQKEAKRVRIKRLLAVYQRAGGAIFHEKPLPQLEKQQKAYPNLLHEDVLDATAAAVEHLVAMIFASAAARRDKAAVHQFSYR